MTEVFHRTFFLEGPGRPTRGHALDHAPPDSGPNLVAVVCHPHPLFGGTMHNKVVYQAAKALHRSGIPVLRFNFRGEGQSEGEHDQGLGESKTFERPSTIWRPNSRGRPFYAGFSFASWVGLRVGCEDPRVTPLIGLGIPVNKSDLAYLASCAKPKLFIQGRNDEFGSRANVEAFVATLPEPKRLVVVPGVDHFFTESFQK